MSQVHVASKRIWVFLGALPPHRTPGTGFFLGAAGSLEPAGRIFDLWMCFVVLLFFGLVFGPWGVAIRFSYEIACRMHNKIMSGDPLQPKIWISVGACHEHIMML